MPSKPSFFDKLVRRSKNKRLGDSLAPPTDSGDELSLRSRASSRASSAHSAVSTPVENSIPTENAPEIAATVPDGPPVSLWPRAYDQVRKENKTLVEEYEKLLAKHLDKDSGSESTSNSVLGNSPEKMALITEQGLEELTNSRIKYTLFGNDFVLMDQAGQLSSTLVGFKDYVAEAFKASPEASMAWAGVALVLPLVTNISTVEAEHKASFIKVLSRMKLYVGMEQLLWPKHLNLQPSARITLEHEITQLYVSIIIFQMESARRFYRRWIMRTVRDAVKYDDWETKVKAVNDAEEVVLNAFRLVTDQAVRSNLDELVLSAGQQTKALISIADDIKSLLDIQTKGVAYTKEIADGVEMLAQAKSKKLETVKLDMFVDTKAQFDSIDSERAGKCFESTRKTIQQRIKVWAASNTGPNILWVRGLAGTGKSTIARTMAANFAKDGVLAGSYFFRRGDEDRTKSANILSTIMDRAIHCVPGLARHVADALSGKDKTWLRDKGLETQFDTLFRTPLGRLLDKGKMSSFTFVIIIDALDECADHGDLGPLIALLSGLNSTEQRFNILLTSRAAGTFESRVREFIVEGEDYINLHLEDAQFSEETQKDIQVYMSDMFTRIKQQFDIEQNPWPTEVQQEILITRAVTPSPLFIYAATLYRFLTNEESLPDDQLEEWLSSVSAGANQLNEIYEPVLKIAFASVGIKRHADLQNLIYAIILARTPLSRRILSEMFSIKLDVVKSLLKTLHSVINLPTGQDDAIEIYHKSFSDFVQAALDTPNAESPYVIPIPEAHGTIAFKCIKLLDAKLMRDICKLGDPLTFLEEVDDIHIQDCIPGSVQYASKNWVHHVLDAQIEGSEIGVISDFLCKHFLHWIECAMLLKDFSNSVSSIINLQSYILAAEHPLLNLLAFLKDAHRFLLFVHDYETSPLQIYGAGLVFCPTSSLIRTTFKKHAVSLGVKVEGIQGHWDSLLQTLSTLPYTDHLEYSDDGRLLLAASANSVQVWDTISGSERFTKVFNYSICEVHFSSDSRLIVVHTTWRDIHIVDAQSGVLKQKLTGFSFLLPSKQGKYLFYSRYKGLHEFNGRGWNAVTMQEVKSMPFTDTEFGKRLFELVESNPESYNTDSSSDDSEFHEHNVPDWESIYESSSHSLEGDENEDEIISSVDSGYGRHVESSAENIDESIAESVAQTCSSSTEETESLGGIITDSETGSIETVWKDLRRQYPCNVLSPDGTISVSCGPNNLIIVGNSRNGKILAEITSNTKRPSMLIISQDNRLLLVSAGSSEPELWNIRDNIRVWTGQPNPTGVSGFIDHAQFSKCGTFVDMYCSKWIYSLNIETLDITWRQFTVNIDIETICATGDGSQVAALASRSFIAIFNSSLDEATVPYTVDEGGYSNAAQSLLVSSQDMVAVQFTDGTIELHDTFNRSIRTMKTNQHMVQFSADGKYLICSFHKTACVAVYDTDSLQSVFTSTYHGEASHPEPLVAISPNGIYLAIATWIEDTAEQLTVWNLQTGYLIRSIPVLPVSLLFFSEDMSEDDILVVIYNLRGRRRYSVHRFPISQYFSYQSQVCEGRGFIFDGSFLPNSSKLAIIYTSHPTYTHVVDLFCVLTGTRLTRIVKNHMTMTDTNLRFPAFPTSDVNVWRRADGYWNLKSNTRELTSSFDDTLRLVYDDDWIAKDGNRVFKLPGPCRLGTPVYDSPPIHSKGSVMVFLTQNNSVVKLTVLDDGLDSVMLDTRTTQLQRKTSGDSMNWMDNGENSITRREVSFGVSDFFYEFATGENDSNDDSD
ncbi:hypothetical protein VHEMI09165 [[Torrubiella] hemipterigena]|uniref:Uncharacterized protein n=1 Tax=[Torrubiella] hemipterigena TaxID=1531966 RepID=A0A0A1TR12_9HYPO|nr:hypothetical protein VHEMI09165 [[Torrubiella] hemipterigena]